MAFFYRAFYKEFREITERLQRIETYTANYSDLKSTVYRTANDVDKMKEHVDEKSKIISSNEKRINGLEKTLEVLKDNTEDIGLLLKEQQDRQKKQEDDKKNDRVWTKRTILGAIITSTISIIFMAIQLLTGLGG